MQWILYTCKYILIYPHTHIYIYIYTQRGCFLNSPSSLAELFEKGDGEGDVLSIYIYTLFVECVCVCVRLSIKLVALKQHIFMCCIYISQLCNLWTITTTINVVGLKLSGSLDDVLCVIMTHYETQCKEYNDFRFPAYTLHVARNPVMLWPPCSDF